jgi:hypothetical protein
MPPAVNPMSKMIAGRENSDLFIASLCRCNQASAAALSMKVSRAVALHLLFSNDPGTQVIRSASKCDLSRQMRMRRVE